MGSTSRPTPAVAPATNINILFVLYGLLGLLTFALYRGLSAAVEVGDGSPPVPLGPSRRRVYGLAALFSVDAFGGGLVVNALLALWLYERFGLSVSTTGAIFFATKLCSAISYFLAVPLARGFGLVNTMVFTHLPANILLMLTAFAPTIEVAFLLLILRGLLSEMDSPTKSSYVMAVVRPEERPAAASVTAVPRSLAAAVAPLLSGWLFTVTLFGWPLVIAGALKAAYDLALLWQFSKVKPPEELKELIAADRRIQNVRPGVRLTLGQPQWVRRKNDQEVNRLRVRMSCALGDPFWSPPAIYRGHHCSRTPALRSPSAICSRAAASEYRSKYQRVILVLPSGTSRISASARVASS